MSVLKFPPAKPPLMEVIRAWVMSGDFGGIPVVDATALPAKLYTGAARRRVVRHGS